MSARFQSCSWWVFIPFLDIYVLCFTDKVVGKGLGIGVAGGWKLRRRGGEEGEEEGC